MYCGKGKRSRQGGNDKVRRPAKRSGEAIDLAGGVDLPHWLRIRKANIKSQQIRVAGAERSAVAGPAQNYLNLVSIIDDRRAADHDRR